MVKPFLHLWRRRICIWFKLRGAMLMKAVHVFALSLMAAGILSLPAFAERTDVTIKGPGVEVKQHRGWFGSGGTQYNDALGNNYSHKKGWFGGESTSGNVFGSKISQSRGGLFGRKNTTVTGPNNEVLVQQKTGLFGGKSVTIDTNS